MPAALRRSLWSVNRFPKSPAILNGLRLLFIRGDNTLYSSNKTLEYDECKTLSVDARNTAFPKQHPITQVGYPRADDTTTLAIFPAAPKQT